MKCFIAPPEHYPWIAERAGIVCGPQFKAIEALNENGQIVGMVGFDGWTPNSVCMHVAIDDPLAVRCLLKPAFGIVFTARNIAIGQVISTNQAALDFDKHLGFKEVARIRDGWKPGVDVVLLEMRRADCRWISAEMKEAA